ncbi:MAG TPA: FtsX-like permease family protein [Bryobacteraceae bacterium]|nr:FtsX-like permease family protein [Bryobacteraceae bacterium]
MLLIACANLANLMLAHTAARQRELGVRAALGAGRWRIVRQLLTESIALAVAGGGAGLLISGWVVRAIANLYPGRLPRLEQMGASPSVFLFALGLTLVAGLLFGLLPAWRFSHPEMQTVWNESGSRSSTSRRGAAVRGVLVAAQVAAALVLLIGAGLLLRSFLLLRGIDPGYRRQNLLTAQVLLPEKLYSTKELQSRFAEEFLDRVRTIPAVESAAITNSMPLVFNMLLSIRLTLEQGPMRGRPVEVGCRSVTPDYFRAMGIGLSAGRYLDSSDTQTSGGVVVNQSFVREYLPEINPLGRRLDFGEWTGTIVGVVPDIKNMRLNARTESELYLPFAKQPGVFLDLAIRTSGEPSQVVSALRAELAAIDRNQPLGKVETMEQILDDSVAMPRFHTTLVGAFAALALVLAGIGIYGVIAYSVSLRTREIGIRMAMGAQRADVLRLVLLRGMLPPLAGVAAGVPVAIAGRGLLTRFLYGVQSVDLATYSAVAVLVLLVALAAAWFPARKAMTVDPMVALRYE